jgi:outer membrane receptor protein involved in Fe transport
MTPFAGRSRSSACGSLVSLLALLACILGPAWGSEQADAEKKEETEAPSGNSAKKKAEPPAPAIPQETVVVTASRTEQPLHEAPSAVSVIGAKSIETAPADDYGDLLRTVPGLNVAQTSAADVQFGGRQATGVISKGQTILIDNRSVVNDFNDVYFMGSFPLDFSEIERIEVVRGPGSAVWGAGASNAVVNIITRRPKDMVGTTLTAGGGEVGTAYGNLSHAGAAGSVSYRVSATWYEQDAYDRPTGTIPDTEGPANPGGTPYPPYPNEGTTQQKLDLRLDWDLQESSTLSFSGGYAGFDGITYTPGGPYFFVDESNSSYGKLDWTRGSMRLSAHVTSLDSNGPFLLAIGPDGRPIERAFKETDSHLEFTDTRLLGTRHLMTYGGNVRFGRYDIDIAPGAEGRDAYGAFVQDDIHLSDKWNWLVGGRFDDIDPMGTAFSPRTSIMFQPVAGQTFRASWNRGFRAPTVVQNYADLQTPYAVTLPTPGGPVNLLIPLTSRGNTDLEEERLDAYEIGWVWNVTGRTTATVSVYNDILRDPIRLVPSEFYTSANPPPGWPYDPALLDVPPPNGFAGLFASELSYQNLGRIENRGVEAVYEFRPTNAWRLWVNASWQDDPRVSGIQQVPLQDGTLVYPINIPPTWRANGGAVWSMKKVWVDMSVNWQDEAFWTDVLDSRFWGPTEAFFQANLGAGVRLAEGAVELSVRAQNVFDERVQQHVWGDIIGRKLTAQVRWAF